MNFDIFVLPFCIGFLILVGVLLNAYLRWIYRLDKDNKEKIAKGIFSIKLFSAIKEIFLESLLHRKIFRVNPLLGYMHMSIAFGWFLLIVIGTIRLSLCLGSPLHLPYEAVFMEFFVHDVSNIPFASWFTFLLDFLLLVVLFGIALALIKRTASKMFGMENATKVKLIDKVALTSLWLIFPVRLMAESFVAGAHGTGGFLTGTLGNFFSVFLPISSLVYPTYWMYSIVLGIFFIMVPFSRYMHIPTEILLIFLKNFSIKTENKYTSFSDVEVNSCPRCGICIDKCQLNTSANIKDTQTVYFLRSIREGCVEENNAFNCLLCGRCKEFCPVGINTGAIRIAKRKEFIDFKEKPFDYLKQGKNSFQRVDVLYFAGCMTHLTPGIKESMIKILNKTKINYLFLDSDNGACCGRPLILTGRDEKAKELIEYNKNLIKDSSAKILVASCPICYKIFKEPYCLEELGVKVMHHTEYLLDLIKSGRLGEVTKTDKRIVYHDPCELGRGLCVYEEPRELLRMCSAELMHIRNEREYALCCGNTLGNLKATNSEKDLITRDALKELTANNPDIVATACPLCKKTFARAISSYEGVEVMDISEIIARST